MESDCNVSSAASALTPLVRFVRGSFSAPDEHSNWEEKKVRLLYSLTYIGLDWMVSSSLPSVRISHSTVSDLDWIVARRISFDFSCSSLPE